MVAKTFCMIKMHAFIWNVSEKVKRVKQIVDICHVTLPLTLFIHWMYTVHSQNGRMAFPTQR